MKRYKGFNFVELMLVMCILGIVITLTMPLLRNIKDDDDIYRAYMKKANQDVNDALSLGLIRNSFLTDLSSLGTVNGNITTSAQLNDNRALATRFLFNTGMRGLVCGTISAGDTSKTFQNSAGNIQNCLTNTTFESDLEDVPAANAVSYALATTTTGIVMPGNAVMMFTAPTAEDADADGTADDEENGIFGYVYVDANGNRGPNFLCKDRYRFILYRDRASLDTTVPKAVENGVIRYCNLEL